jgi:hypothetical protein
MSTSASNPSLEDVKVYDTEQLATFLESKNLILCKDTIPTLREQRVDGPAFVQFTFPQLILFLPIGDARKLTQVIEELNGQSKFYHNSLTFVRLTCYSTDVFRCSIFVIFTHPIFFCFFRVSRYEASTIVYSATY